MAIHVTLHLKGDMRGLVPNNVGNDIRGEFSPHRPFNHSKHTPTQTFLNKDPVSQECLFLFPLSYWALDG